MTKRYIVLRGGLKDGWWFDRSRAEEGIPIPLTHAIRFEPTGETETREDGAIAEVYRPVEEPA